MMGKPKIRFKGYNEDWEQRKVSEMFKVARGYVLPATDTSQEMTDEIPYPVYSSQTKDNGLMGYYSDYLYEDAITWTTDGANAGTVNFRAGKFYCTNVCGVLLSDKIETNKVIAEALNNVAKRYVSYVGNPKLMNNVMADIQIAVPTSQKERDRISSYFSYLDHLITLHQRKIYIFIKKMPIDWEQRKFSELVMIERGGSPRPIDKYITKAENGLNWVKIGDAPEQGNYITKTSEKIIPEGLSKTREVHPGDLILSNSMSFGRPYIMAIDGCIHDGWLAIRDTEKRFDLKFLCTLLGTDSMLNQYKAMAAGSTVNNLNKELVGSTTVSFPKMDEQTKIGECFTNLDHLITLHHRECIILRKTKVNDWEQRKLGDLVLDHNAGIYISKENYGEGINVIGVGNIYDSDIFYGEIYRLGPVNDDKFLLEEDDIIYGESSLVPEGIARTVCVGKNGAGSAFAWHTRRVKLDNNIVNSHVATLELNYLHDVRKYLVSVSTQTALTGITTDGYFGTTLVLPSVEEQHKISDYFKSIDHLITLHQRKIYIFIKKMPIDWEQRKLGEVMVSLQNNTLSRADLSNETGIAKNVHYGDVLIKFGEVLDVSEENLPMISDESVLIKYKASFLQNGDVIVADTAEDSTVGKCSEIAGLNDEVVLSGLHTIPYRPIEKFASGYLGYYLNSSAYHKQLIPLMQGIKVTSISKSAMQDTKIVYPKSMEEQGKIGNYFRNLDHLITLHQHKCDELQNLKKYMLQNMFV